MKFYYALFVTILTACLSISFASCGDDDDEESTDLSSPYQLVGKWILESVDGEKLKDNKHYIVLDANYKYEVFPKGNPFGIRDTGSWKLDNQNLMFNNSSTFHVVKLTTTTLVVSSDSQNMVFQREGSNPYNSTTLKLIGKWEERTYQFHGNPKKTYNDSRRYLILNADFSFEVNPYNLFEAEKRGGKWSLTDNNSVLIFNNDEEDSYKIIQLTETTLQLGWLEMGDVIEKTTFERVE